MTELRKSFEIEQNWKCQNLIKHEIKNGILILLNNTMLCDVYQSLSQLPESVREIIDVDHSKNLVIQI